MFSSGRSEPGLVQSSSAFGDIAFPGYSHKCIVIDSWKCWLSARLGSKLTSVIVCLAGWLFMSAKQARQPFATSCNTGNMVKGTTYNETSLPYETRRHPPTTPSREDETPRLVHSVLSWDTTRPEQLPTPSWHHPQLLKRWAQLEVCAMVCLLINSSIAVIPRIMFLSPTQLPGSPLGFKNQDGDWDASRRWLQRVRV